MSASDRAPPGISLSSGYFYPDCLQTHYSISLLALPAVVAAPRLTHAPMNALRAKRVTLAFLLATTGCLTPEGLLAQNTPADEVEAPIKLEPFIVTGSMIKRTEFEGPSPLQVVTREDIERVAGTGLADVLRDLPESTSIGFHEHGSSTSIRGVTALDLRSLGAANTLILVDGRRQAPNGIPGGATTFVDLNRFPTAMIERIEILKDGAAAVYGADATAGVVNIILRNNFSGTEFAARYGNYFATDGGETSWSLLAGGTRGRARAMIGLTYSTRKAIASSDLPFSANADQTEIWRAIDPVKYAAKLLPTGFSNSFFDLRSFTGPYATVAVPTITQLAHPSNGLTIAAIRNPLTGVTATNLPGTGGLPQGTLGRLPNRASVPRINNSGRPTAAEFVARSFEPGPISNSYNFQEFVWNTSEADRRGVSSRFGFEFNEHIEFYGAASWTRLETRTQFAPPPIATFSDNSILVPATNPYNPFGIPVFFTYRSLEVGARKVRVLSDSINLTAGLQGKIRQRFEWDLGWSYSRNESKDTQTDLSESAVRAALARTTPDALNIFGGPNFKNDPAIIESIKVNTTRSGDGELGLADFRITTTELVTLPTGPVGASFSTEHRLERYNITNDERSSVLDDLIGSGRGFGPTHSRRDVQSVAAELRLPLVKEGRWTWLHTAELSTAARFERFSEGYDSGVKPFAGLRLRMTEHLLLRASYGQVFRAPSLPQLYGGIIEQFVAGFPDLRRPFELTGDPIDALPAPRLLRSGGNLRLQPEDGITRQVGFVIDIPGRIFRGLTLDFTYGIIEQEGLIRDSLGINFIFQNELNSTADLVAREPTGGTFTNTTAAPIPILSGPDGATTLLLPGQSATVPGRITTILDSAINVSDQIVRYYDYGLRYRRSIDPLGTFTLSSNWTYYGFYSFRKLPSDPSPQLVGRTIPRYRGQNSISWEKGAWNANAGMNYIHRYRNLVTDGWEVSRYYTFSAGLGYVFPADSALKGLRLSLGVEKLFDRDPSADLSGAVGYDQGFVGRPAGRYWFVAVKQTY